MIDAPSIGRAFVASLIATTALAGRAPVIAAQTAYEGSRLYVVDCLLPAKVRKLGTSLVYAGPRRAVKKTAVECEILGGEYVAYDRANYETAMKVWLPLAEQGNAEAQYYVGEIHERGLGVDPDYAKAAVWFEKAAAQGERRAALGLGVLYELGRGVPQDAARALEWYRRAQGLKGPPPAEAVPPAKSWSATAPKSEAPTAHGSGVQMGARLTQRPTIALLEPMVPRSRGDIRVPLPAQVKTKQIVGKVRAPRGIETLKVNDRDVLPDKSGLFHASVAISGPETEVRIVARDRQGEAAEMRFGISTGATAAPAQPLSTPEGRAAYRALVIGNDNYQHWEPLSSARNDAQAVARVLEQRYGFRTTLLLDATHDQILNALNELRKTLTERDNLVIYYAGHGALDAANVRAHWIPIDGDVDKDTRWIPSFRVTDHLNGMNAHKVLVISDSCYSGALTLGALGVVPDGMDRDGFTQAVNDWIAPPRSRTVLTSGSILPVMDGGGGEHSVFARSLLDVLEANREPLDGYSLFLAVEARVSQAAARFRIEQIPQYAPLQHAGHEGGDVVIVRKGDRR